MNTLRRRCAPVRGVAPSFLVGGLLWLAVLAPAPVRAQIVVTEPAAAGDAQQEPRSVLEQLPLLLHRPAPDLGIDEWLGQAKLPGAIRSVVRADGGDAGELGDLSEVVKEKIQEALEGASKAVRSNRRAKKSPGNLASYHQKVVVVHVIDWADPATSTDLIELMRVVAKANSDRGMQLLGIMQEGEKAQKRATGTKLDWPVAMTSLRDSPSAYIVRQQQPRAFVIGRSGDLRWMGSPSSDRAGFLKALQSAFEGLACERIETNLAAELTKAIKDYYGGALAKSVSSAKRLRGSASRNAAGAVEVDANNLISKAHDTEVAWLQAMRKAADRRKEFDQYLRHVDALVAAFPKTSGKEARAHEKQLGKKSNYTMRLKDERAWLKCHSQRPALFPARQDKAGTRFSKRVAKFVQGARHATDAVSRGQDLLDRFRAATK